MKSVMPHFFRKQLCNKLPLLYVCMVREAGEADHNKRRVWMMLRTLAMASLALGVLFGSVGGTLAGPRAAKFKHADRNKDGKISRKEWKAEKKWENRQKSKVDTAWEAKADKNDDGVVQPAEAHKAKAQGYLNTRSAVNRPWEAKADTDNDGKVSAAELRAHHLSVLDSDGDGKIDAAERKAYWVNRKSKVNTAVEAKYDADGNGWISGDEAGEMLRDRLRIINTHGRAKVDSALEAEYDADGDGIVDREEAEAIRDALGLE
jgi:Ca2+-binding EF-hand superfamily protein